MDLIQCYPQIFSGEDALRVEDHVSMARMTTMLKGFGKSKIPGPARCLVEFYLEFIDILGPELLDVIEESRCKGFL